MSLLFTILQFFPKMAAMLIIAGQAYLFTYIVLSEYTDAMYDKTNDLYQFRSYLNEMYVTDFFGGGGGGGGFLWLKK